MSHCRLTRHQLEDVTTRHVRWRHDAQSLRAAHVGAHCVVTSTKNLLTLHTDLSNNTRTAWSSTRTRPVSHCTLAQEANATRQD